ncbi:MAG: hypothetical protein EZS26_003725 [Candidatus Ordinivivax streblomastigis]|uniref:AI-2E family transporter n=1 Tax=Candidatus Ordinivivax streblomastigis TaxID=2540710 RepID=A0A5M8NTM7_9BACT|nr:MAG: hypothetical protein EZS26_003725 [Candidatus Ordinivivax streblomastigis]
MYEGKPFNEKVRQIGFLLLIVGFAWLIFTELRYFVSAFLGGFTFYMILRNPHRLLRQKGWNNTLATSVLIIASLAVLILILGGIGLILYYKLQYFHPQMFLSTFHDIHGWVNLNWGYDIFSEDVLRNLLAWVSSIIPSILSVSGSVLANAAMMLLVLFFMLQESEAFQSGIEQFLPMSGSNIQMMKQEANSIIVGNAIGIPVVMLGQGITAALAYWILDAGDPVIWGLFTGLFGLIPVIGTGGIWLPMSINLILGDHLWQGIVLLAYGICVISSVDNLVRMVFLKKKANIHPLTTLFGIILGIRLFGFWGIIFGPLLLSSFFLMLKIYKNEFSKK